MKHLFEKHGRRIEAQANFRLPLQKEGAVWFLEKGAMILFAVQNKEGQEGRRTLLSTVQAGRLLFDMEKKEAASFDIFAFSEEPVVLWEMEMPILKETLKASSEDQEVFSPLLEHYLNQFSHFVSSSVELRPKHWVLHGGIGMKKGETFTLKISEVPTEKGRVAWLSPQEGEYKLLGPHEMKFSEGSFPLLPHLYFLSLSTTTFEAKSTLEMIQSGDWQSGLSQFHHFIGDYLVYKRAFLDDEELRRFQEKEKLQEDTLHQTLT
ncbi:MAG: hypothetical protein KDK64_00930, partial [Chlamydiia bacterium]|nr:hypothetical protein [Chlamydiia bacterium]